MLFRSTVGVLAGFNGTLALICAGVWLLVAVVTRYSSLAALVAAISMPVAAYALGLGNIVLIAVSAMSIVLVLRHRDNIKRLLAGSEGKLGKNKT